LRAVFIIKEDDALQKAKLNPMDFTVADSFAEADEEDRAYFWSLTPLERLAITEELRRRNYGDAAVSARLLRVLEITERPLR